MGRISVLWFCATGFLLTAPRIARAPHPVGAALVAARLLGGRCMGTISVLGFRADCFYTCCPACRWGTTKGGKGTSCCPFPSFASSLFHRLPFAPPRRADGDASHDSQGALAQAEQVCCIRFRVPAFGAFHERRDRVLFVRHLVCGRASYFTAFCRAGCAGCSHAFLRP